MNEDGFKQFLRPYIKEKIPFLAYWHPQGMGLIRLDEVQVPCMRGNVQTTRPKTLGPRGRATWEKNLARLRRQSWSPVITVEFDGNDIKIEGGELTL